MARVPPIGRAGAASSLATPASRAWLVMAWPVMAWPLMVTPLHIGCAAGASAPATRAPAEPRLLLVDVDADPLGLGGNPGAVFEIDRRTREARVLASSREFVDPVDVLAEPDGSLLVLDLDGLGGDGRILRSTADGKQVARVALPPALVDPTAFARAPDGAIWVCDRGGEGALFRFAADLARVEKVASGAPLAAPSDVCFAGGETFVLDADAFRERIQDLSEGGVFRVGPSMRRDAAGARLETVARLGLVSPLSLLPFGDGGFLVVDVNADPAEPRLLRGGVFMLDRERKLALFARSDEWRDPSSAVLVGGELLVVDGSSDPLGLGADPTGSGFGGNGRGGIYSVDLETRAVALVCASPGFVNPARLRAVP